VMGRVEGWVGAPEVEGGRIDPCAMLSFSNFFILPASRGHCQHTCANHVRSSTYESIPTSVTHDSMKPRLC
jgi:hypothetical protein